MDFLRFIRLILLDAKLPAQATICLDREKIKK
jgi:hypothetical protein